MRRNAVSCSSSVCSDPVIRSLFFLQAVARNIVARRGTCRGLDWRLPQAVSMPYYFSRNRPNGKVVNFAKMLDVISDEPSRSLAVENARRV
ncbi:hypothetical protein LIA77_07483 [Sarocladium implicatum]|nr:hypothetical protein LIA77_07483 [Sarocladium implicatum]